MACKCCQKVISNSDRIVCRGFCGESFHAICVRVDCSLKDVLGLNERNVYWMCDTCSELFTNDHFRSILNRHDTDTAGIPNSISSIQNDIMKLNSTVTALAAKIDSKPRTPFRFNSNGSRLDDGQRNPSENTPKRRRGENGATVSSKPSCGTKVSCSSIKMVKTSKDLFWIHLSAFHPTTTEEEISGLVRECLQLDEDRKPKVIKLIPKGRDPATLNFISFKVGVGSELKQEALSCETWPQDVLFREFEDDRAKNVSRIIRVTPEETKSLPSQSTESSIADPPPQGVN